MTVTPATRVLCACVNGDDGEGGRGVVVVEMVAERTAAAAVASETIPFIFSSFYCALPMMMQMV
jgi:hypothetical protein